MRGEIKIERVDEEGRKEKTLLNGKDNECLHLKSLKCREIQVGAPSSSSARLFLISVHTSKFFDVFCLAELPVLCACMSVF